MRNLIISVFIVTSLAACSTPPQTVTMNAVNSFFIDDRVDAQKNYQPNTLQTVYVGEPVIKRKTFLLKVKSELVGTPAMDIQLGGRDLILNLRAGKNYPIKYEVNLQGKMYKVLEVYHNMNDRYYGVPVGDDGSLANVIFDGNLQLPGVFQITPINASVPQQRVETVMESRNTENFEIVFGGISNNEINLTYREFTPDDTAKTAFYQNLTYPLDSRFIRYKGMQIKVHQITPEFISYVVVAE